MSKCLLVNTQTNDLLQEIISLESGTVCVTSDGFSALVDCRDEFLLFSGILDADRNICPLFVPLTLNLFSFHIKAWTSIIFSSLQMTSIFLNLQRKTENIDAHSSLLVQRKENQSNIWISAIFWNLRRFSENAWWRVKFDRSKFYFVWINQN